MSDDLEQRLSRKSRFVAIVIAGVMLLWLGAQALGSALGLPVRYVFLFDLLAIAGFVWCLIVMFQIWQTRKNMKK